MKQLTSDMVAQYLQDNPQFFEAHQEMLAHLNLPHPHGGRTISLSERQVLTLREKNRALEGKLAELIRFGEENDAIGERVHRLSIALIKAQDWAHVLRVTQRHLVEDFEVPHVAIRLWGLAVEGAECADVSPEARALIASQSHPYCGAADKRPSLAWFGESAAAVRSLCEIPLRRGSDVIGAIALGSEDAERFYAGMGTLFLSQIGNLVAAAASRTAAQGG
ncbi:MAG: hypothetical protein RIR70_2129 [Pseudomonadota bacterium]|jgi:uncharacterized protein YigA (DUF484 family)